MTSTAWDEIYRGSEQSQAAKPDHHLHVLVRTTKRAGLSRRAQLPRFYALCAYIAAGYLYSGAALSSSTLVSIEAFHFFVPVSQLIVISLGRTAT